MEDYRIGTELQNITPILKNILIQFERLNTNLEKVITKYGGVDVINVSTFS